MVHNEVGMGNVAGHKDQIEGGACNVGGAVKGLTKARPHPSISSDMNGKITRSQERVRPRQKSGHQTLASPLKRKRGTLGTHEQRDEQTQPDHPKTECGRSRRSQRVVRSMSTRTRILRQDAKVFGGSPQARVPA